MNYITYLRVSTDAQKQSGLGIEAQRALVMQHIKQQEGKLTAEFIDYESGRKINESQRPNLHMALRLLKGTPNCKLLLAKTDRLARDLHFISGLLKDNVPLIVAGHENMSKLEWHMHAMIAEHEAEMISQRTKAALAEARKRGVFLGAPLDKIPFISAQGGAATSLKSRLYRENIAPLLVQLMNDRSLHRGRLRRYNTFLIAERLNNLGIKTATGKAFTDSSVYYIIKLQGLKNEFKIY